MIARIHYRETAEQSNHDVIQRKAQAHDIVIERAEHIQTIDIRHSTHLLTGQWGKSKTIHPRVTGRSIRRARLL